MKNQLLKIMLFLLSLGMAIGCSKEDGKEQEDITPVSTNFTLFKNQTGNPAVNALQAQYTGELNDYRVNFYGTFNEEGAPTDIHTITYQKTDNDTVVNLLFNQVTKRLSSAFISVNNVKSPIVTRYDYPENNPGVVTVSMYNYDWNAQSSELLITVNMEKDTGPLSDSRENMSGLGSDTAWGIAAIATGIGFAEAVAAYVGGYSAVATASGVVSTMLTGTIAVSIVVPVAIGVAILAITSILNNAGASELKPGDASYPSNTQVINPANGNDPTLYLPSPVCKNTRITFSASMDAEGTIMLWGVNGGSGNYSYLVNSLYQQSEVFSNNYPDGKYLVAVRDGNGCTSIKIVILSRDLVNVEGWYSGTYTLSNGIDASGYNPYNYEGLQQTVYVYKYFDSADDRWKSVCYFTQPALNTYYYHIAARNTINFIDNTNAAIISYPSFVNSIGVTDCAGQDIPSLNVDLNLGTMRFTNQISVSTNDQAPGSYRIFGKYHNPNDDTCHDIDLKYEVRVHADYNGPVRPEGMSNDIYAEIMSAKNLPAGYDITWD